MMQTGNINTWNAHQNINIIILMFLFIFYSICTSVTFDSSIRGDPSKKIWKENNSNFHMIPITQNVNFAPCDGFSQITSHIGSSKFSGMDDNFSEERRFQ